MSAHALSFVVVVCTRNRPDQVLETLDLLDRQAEPDFPLVMVDQSDEIAPQVRARFDADPRKTLIPDQGRGLSRARNVAWRATSEDWLVFVDDDCVPALDFTAEVERAIREHPDVDLISGHVGPRYVRPRQPDDLPFSTFEVEEERTFSGTAVHPSLVAFGVSFAVRRTMVDAVGGWDERLGPGAPDFPASDDMDFNLRMLRAGATTLVTPRIRAEHDQWRTREEIVQLYAGYTASWMGLCAKLWHAGDRRTALRFWWQAGPRFSLVLVLSGLRRRSRFRVRTGVRSLGGMVEGLRAARQRSW